MPVNDKILYTDFNTLRDAIATLLGTGSGNSGYGQTVQSTQVSGANGTGAIGGPGSGASVISITEYTKLRSDIINVYRHIYGVDPTPANPILGQLIRYVTAGGAVASEFNISEYNIAEYNAASVGASDDPYTQYSVFITDLQGNRFTCATSQSVTESKGTAFRGTAWGGGLSSISTRIKVAWSSANAARYFFNSGGEIRITATRSGGSVTAQNTAWTNLLNGAGTRTISAQLPQTSLTGTAGQNWFTLSNVYQGWYSITDSGPYANNNYSLQARTLDGLTANNNSGTSAGLDIIALFTDNYRDPDDTAPSGPGQRTAPDDSVDGSLQVVVTCKRAFGILQPEPSTGNFTIETPTVTIVGGSTSTGNYID